MIDCGGCYPTGEGFPTACSLTVSDTTGTLSIPSPTYKYEVGELVPVESGSSYTSTDDEGNLIYSATPLSGYYPIVSFVPFTSAGADGSPPAVPATIIFTLPAGGSFAANGYNASTILDGLTSAHASQICVGMEVTGPGVASGTYVIDKPDSQSVQLSKPITLSNPPSANGTYTFIPNYIDDPLCVTGTEGAGRQCGGVEDVSYIDVTSRFGSLSLSISGSADYSYSKTSGSSTSSSSGTSSSSDEVEKTSSAAVTSSFSFSPFLGYPAAIPPGQFVVLKCPDCCAQCFYLLLYTAPTGTNLLSYPGDPHGGTISSTGRETSTYNFEGSDGSGISSETVSTNNVSVPVNLYSVGPQYFDIVNSCLITGDISESAFFILNEIIATAGAGTGTFTTTSTVTTTPAGGGASTTTTSTNSGPQTIDATALDGITPNAYPPPPATPTVTYTDPQPPSSGFVIRTNPCAPSGGSQTLTGPNASANGTTTVRGGTSTSGGTTTTTDDAVTTVSWTGSLTVEIQLESA